MSLKLKRDIEPKFHIAENVGIIKPEIFNLENGIKLYTINTGSEDIISLELIFNAGAWYEETPLTAMFTNLLMVEGGTKQHSAYNIAELFEYYGANISSGISKDTASIKLSFLNKYSEQLIPLLSSIVYDAIFDEKEVEIQQKRQKQKFIINLEKPNFIASRKIIEQIFGNNNKYGYIESIDDYDNINSNSLKDFYKKHYRNNDLIIFVSGKIPNNFFDIINKYFGINKIHNSDKQTDSVSFNNNASKVFFQKKGVVQDSVRMGKIIPNNNIDMHGLKILTTILGGYFGSRLMKNIREDKGFTYGIYSHIINLRHASTLLIGAETLKHKGQIVIDEIYKELSKLSTETITNKELDLVKNFLLGSLQRNFDGHLTSAEMIKFLIKNQLNENYYNDYFNRIINISSEELNILANNFFHKNMFNELIVSD